MPWPRPVLVERGFFTSRARAQEAIAAGLVSVDGVRLRKASDMVAEETVIEAQSVLRAADGNFDYLEEKSDALGVRSNIGMLGPEAFNYKNGCPSIAPVTAKG